MSDVIFRAVDDEDDQAHIPHATLWDHRLSVRARGLLAMLLCLSPGRGVSMASLAREMRAEGGAAVEGRDALRRARGELERAGYLVTTQTRDERGQWVAVTRVYRKPHQTVNAQVSPGPGNPAPENQGPGIQAPDTNPQVSPGPGNPAPENPAPENQALSSKNQKKNGTEEEEDARARAASDRHVDSGVMADPLAGRLALQGLAVALVDADVMASWPTSPAALAEIEGLVARHGVERLVAAAVQQDANARRRPDRTTAEYVSAFLARWRRLTYRPALVEVPTQAEPPAAVPAGDELRTLRRALTDAAEQLGQPDAALRRCAREELAAEGLPEEPTSSPRYPRYCLDVERRALDIADRRLRRAAGAA